MPLHPNAMVLDSRIDRKHLFFARDEKLAKGSNRPSALSVDY